MRTKRVQFSLVELLLVICLLTILSSLVYPSLKSLFQVQKKITCLNNLREVYTTTTLYCDDYNNLLPYRQQAAYPHQLKSYIHSYDYNKHLIQAYGADRSSFFCPSDLLEARNTNTPGYRDIYVTYSYFHDANLKWKVPRPNLNYLNASYDKNYPLWGCLSIQTVNQQWFGHDRPVIDLIPEGMNSTHLDGSARWNFLEDCSVFYTIGTLNFYQPNPI